MISPHFEFWVPKTRFGIILSRLEILKLLYFFLLRWLLKIVESHNFGLWVPKTCFGIILSRFRNFKTFILLLSWLLKIVKSPKFWFWVPKTCFGIILSRFRNFKTFITSPKMTFENSEKSYFRVQSTKNMFWHHSESI